MNQPASFTLTYTPASGCAAAPTVAEQVASTMHTVQLDINYNTCSCAAAAAPAQTTYTFQPTQAGTYYLRFTGTNTYITDTLVAK